MPTEVNRPAASGQREPLGIGALSVPSWGEISLGWRGKSLEQLRFGSRLSELHALGDAAYMSVPTWLCDPLLAYFGGEALNLQDEIPVTLRGTEFQVRVWQALKEIPRGQVWTYGELTAHIGLPGGARAVGSANGKNPIALVVPCHRVVGAGGRLGGYTGGLDIKRRLLAIEGAQCTEDRVFPGQSGLFAPASP